MRKSSASVIKPYRRREADEGTSSASYCLSFSSACLYLPAANEKRPLRSFRTPSAGAQGRLGDYSRHEDKPTSAKCRRSNPHLEKPSLKKVIRLSHQVLQRTNRSVPALLPPSLTSPGLTYLEKLRPEDIREETEA